MAWQATNSNGPIIQSNLKLNLVYNGRLRDFRERCNKQKYLRFITWSRMRVGLKQKFCLQGNNKPAYYGDTKDGNMWGVCILIGVKFKSLIFR